MKLGCIREIFKIKKCKSVLLLQVTEKTLFMLLSNIIRKTLNSQKRIEKEITLLNFRDIDFKWSGVMVHVIQIYFWHQKKTFMLAMISRSSPKKRIKEKGHHSHVTTTSKRKLNVKQLVNLIYACMTANIIQCI